MSRIRAGEVVPRPILLLEASMYRVLESMFRELGRARVLTLNDRVSDDSSPSTVLPVTVRLERVVVPVMVAPAAVRAPVAVMLPLVARVI